MTAPSIPPMTSASQLVTYSMCARRFAHTYIWGTEPEFKSMALIMGSIVHAGIGWWFEEKLAGRVPTLEALDRIVEADVLAETSGTDAIRWKKDADDSSLEADAKKYLRVFLDEMGDLDVKAVEEPFRVPLVDPDTGVVLGRDVRGFFDLTLAKNRVVEIKTSARGWREEELARHLQIGAYAYAFNTMHGGPSELEVAVIVKLKKAPRVERYKIERGEADTRWWIYAAAAIESAIASGNFPPSPSMLCAECEYSSACLRITTGQVPVASTEPRDLRRLELVA